MKSIDERIKQALEQEVEDGTLELESQSGFWRMLRNPFRGSLRTIVILVNVMTLVISAVLLWCGYQFFVQQELQAQLFWGICFIASLVAQIAMKQWLWQEILRNNLLQEIKRLEYLLSQK